MEKSVEDRLSHRLEEAFAGLGGLSVRAKDETIEIVDRDGRRLLYVTLYRGEWTVYGEDGHAHLNDFGEAVDLMIALLGGKARFVSEYRGEELASTWIEMSYGEAYETIHQAIFLSPFEEDEWVLWPNEEWRVVRKTFVLSDEGVTEDVFERRAESPSVPVPEMAGWLETALGPPIEGMRWKVGGQSRFVFQAPSGWRRRMGMRSQEHQFSDFVSPIDDFVFRSRAYFRPAQSKSELQTRSVRPASVEYRLQDPSESDPNWITHSWALLFSDGEEEMMGILELFRPVSSTARFDDLLRSIELSVNDARFVPHEWKMGEEREGA